MKYIRAHSRGRRTLVLFSTASLVVATSVGCTVERLESAAVQPRNFATLCSPTQVSALAASLSDGVSVREIDIDPKFPGGVRYVAASAGLPAYCQVTGTYVTNPATGKTASFLATLPEAWNGKYLQVGCGGHCGMLMASNPAMPLIAIATPSKPGQIIQKGYATFATDEGHSGMAGGAWAVKGPGQVDEDAITDYLYRSHQVLARMGKAFTRSFYAGSGRAQPKIARSYFSGCSGGGRDALVAASYFPEEFDGIIAGSAYNLAGRSFHSVGTALAAYRSPAALLTPELHALFDRTVKAQCDGIDGVEDGLIQNPAACNFLAERDLRKCEPGQSSNHCFTQAQIETASAVMSAVTDEQGNVVQPGFSVSEFIRDYGYAPLTPPQPALADLWPDTRPAGGLFVLANAVIKVFAHNNDPAFRTQSIVTLRDGGAGRITGFRAVVPRAEVDFVTNATRKGIGHFPENADKLISQGRKLLIWHNLSDQMVTPYMSVNYYTALAKRHGGYAKLQQNVRLFALPGTAHCGAGGTPVGPGNFDALSAIENWVEKGEAPNALLATLYQPTPTAVDFSKPLGRTMPLCKFPEMARYKGTGDVKDAANWSCPSGDTSMLNVGESGRRAGVIP